MKKWILVLSVLLVSPAFAAEGEQPSLATELESLNSPANELPGAISQEKLYSVQTRYSSLNNRFELTGSAGQQVTDTGFMTTRDLGVGARYYFNSRWSVGGSYTFVSNQFTDTAQRLYEKQGIVPDLPYTTYRGELTARFNLFYGKFRVSMDRVLYFDQYVSLGPAVIGLSNGNTVGGVADLGFVFWIGSNWSARFGVKDYVYNEIPTGSMPKKSLVNNVLVYLDMGYLFGKGV